ncbi:hypothetical protein E2C01_020378 [Portunus trituberculatus]|uniref:Uncharacterized protein n=1 Tax=Portunus trituberculatus TaxID=210409 RepID=A0A5B7DZQ6_PORTR|nr:hypothetical protein [Portunus trituberculatus]
MMPASFSPFLSTPPSFTTISQKHVSKATTLNKLLLFFLYFHALTKYTCVCN